jgi:YidC/Oxa1 family membrane protein insertase
MLDPLFEGISITLNFFYTLVPDYAFAIAGLTCVVMLITTPLTLKGTRSMIEMQRLQPEIRRLQAQYKDDRQKLNEEMMKFYREHEINPVGGCLPLLIQAPVFSILFYVVRGLTSQAKFVGVQELLQAEYFPGATVTAGFRPKYLHQSTELYQALVGQTEMNSLGINLADSPAQALSLGFLTALPYIVLVAIIAVLSWYQQKQIMGRNAGAEVTQQQQLMMRIGPLMYVFFAFISPAAIGIYFLVSTLWRVGQQAFITRSMFRGEDSIGVQAQRAMKEVRESRKADGAKGGPTDRAGARSNGGAKASKATKATGAAKATRTKGPVDAGSSGNGSGAGRGAGGGKQTTGAGAAAPGARPHPRSRKKRKRK